MLTFMFYMMMLPFYVLIWSLKLLGKIFCFMFVLERTYYFRIVRIE